MRIPMAIDGHFWIDGQLNGEPVKFLVDSGATMTTIGRQTAERAGVVVSPSPDQVVRTGNGLIKVVERPRRKPGDRVDRAAGHGHAHRRE